MNQITKLSHSQFIAPVHDRATADALSRVKNSAMRDYPSGPEILTVPIPPAIRAQLEVRKLALERCLAPCTKADHPELAKQIAGMLGAFGGNSGGSPEAVVAKYLHVLADLPAWAIVEACRALERGEVEGASLDFRPAAARVRDTARALTEPWLEEFWNLKRVLEMPALEPEDEATRERVGKQLEELAKALKENRKI